MAQSEIPSQIKDNVLQYLYTQGVDSRIQAMILDLVNQALRTHSILLSNQEKYALTRDVTRDILEKMLVEYEN